MKSSHPRNLKSTTDLTSSRRSGQRKLKTRRFVRKMLLKDKPMEEDRTLLLAVNTSVADTSSFPTCPVGVSVRQCSYN